MFNLSRKNRKKIRAVLICVLVIGSAFAGSLYLCLNQFSAKYEMQINELNTVISQNKRNVYRAISDIPAGTTVDATNTEFVSVFSENDEYMYITSEDFGKIASADIYAGQDIFTNMVGNQLAYSLRECEFALLTLGNNLVNNDFIDVRIMYPNGENYVVLSKKCIQSLSLENNAVILWLTEDEIMDMSSAIVDTYLHSGTILYTTKYIEDQQEPLTRCYQPSADCMIAIANDPNIVDEAREAVTDRMSATLREATESRLAQYKNKDGGSGSNTTSENLTDNFRVGNYTGEDGLFGADSSSSYENSDSNNEDIVSNDVSTETADDSEFTFNADDQAGVDGVDEFSFE